EAILIRLARDRDPRRGQAEVAHHELILPAAVGEEDGEASAGVRGALARHLGFEGRRLDDCARQRLVVGARDGTGDDVGGRAHLSRAGERRGERTESNEQPAGRAWHHSVGSGEVHRIYERGAKPVELLRLWRARRGVVHAPEVDGTTTAPVEADDHVELLAVLRTQVVLGDLAAPRHLALHYEVVALPMGLDLDVPTAVDLLLELPAVVVQHQGLAAVRCERHGRVGRDDRDGGGRMERQVHRLAHPLTLLVAHPPPPLTPAPAPKPAATPAQPTTPATEAAPPGPPTARALHSGATASAIGALHQAARVVTLPRVVRPPPREIRTWGGLGHPDRAAEQRAAHKRDQHGRRHRLFHSNRKL